jgi:4-alpha-glucanotransferase
MADGQSSPYSACSAMAIDPIYIRPDAVDDFVRAGGAAALGAPVRAALDAARRSPHVDYAAVRRAKGAAMDVAFDRFHRDEWLNFTTRAADLAGFVARERWWLDDYALYRALARREATGDWRRWPAALTAREPAALREARRHLATDILREHYLQWVADAQWRRAREAARAYGVRVYGDMPFVVDTASADVWSRAADFHLDLSAGVPPDAFSATGQDWGLPVYRWDAVAAGGYEWLAMRARRARALFDGIRLDHLVGFFRTYARDASGHAGFLPPDQADQARQGEAVLQVVRGAGLDVLAEDLGVIPDFVRATLDRLEVPGFKVFRWERDYDAPGEPFLDPSSYPIASVAATGTHDTETMAAWWEGLTGGEKRSAVAREVPDDQPFTGEIRDRLLTRVLHARSAYAFLPMQDLFGWTDRINTPATVGAGNWTWRLPWPVDTWSAHDVARERAAFCRRTITRA